jgi:hypothetical protein
MIFKKYRLNDGRIYWHKLYFALMPKWTTKYAPPLGTYNYAGYLYRPHEYAIDLYNQARWFIQRGSRGYADCDVWSIDGYLNGWLPKALRRLATNKIGHPIGMTMKGWQTRLETMADGFDAAREIQDMTYEPKSIGGRLAWGRFHRGMKLFHEHYFSLWD